MKFAGNQRSFPTVALGLFGRGLCLAVLVLGALNGFIPRLVADQPSGEPTGKKVGAGWYDEATLDAWSNAIQSRVQTMLREEIAPAVPEADQAAMQGLLKDGISIDCPHNFGPFDTFSSQAFTRPHVMVIPPAAVKFLSDLIYIQVLNDNSAYRMPVEILRYVATLKYRDAGEFPGGKYPSPFECFIIPHDKMRTPDYFDPRLRHAYDTAFHTALLFLVAHETHHLLGNDHGLGGVAVTQEMAADDFAITVLEHRGLSPESVMYYFSYFSLWLENPCDYKTNEAFMAALAAAGHPTNGDRINAIGLRILREPAAFVPGATNDDPRVQAIRKLGNQMIQNGTSISDLANNENLRRWVLLEDLTAFVPTGDGLGQGADTVQKSLSPSSTVQRAKACLLSAQSVITHASQEIDKMALAHQTLANDLPELLPDGFRDGMDALQLEIKALKRSHAEVSLALDDAVQASASDHAGSTDDLSITLRRIDGFRDALIQDAKGRGDFQTLLAQMIDTLTAENPAERDELMEIKNALNQRNFDRQLQLHRSAVISAILATMVMDGAQSQNSNTREPNLIP